MHAHPVLDPGIPLSAYREVDLSTGNPRLGDALSSATRCGAFLEQFLKEEKGRVAWGGYLERRNLYRGFGHFNQDRAASREYHLGIDFWADAGTGVFAPWEGRVHSFANRTGPGDYGPVILLEHQLEGHKMYSLFGHLAASSLEGLYAGKAFGPGARIGHLGTPQENGGYSPHLHFQLVRDLQGFQGDYPGVCAARDLGFYRENCPDPMELLRYF